MATKAQRARNEMERSGANGKTAKKKATATRRPGPSKEGLGTAARNLMGSKTRLSKAMVNLEDSATGKPSRKSTRGVGGSATRRGH